MNFLSFIKTLMLKQTAPARTDKSEQVSHGLRKFWVNVILYNLFYLNLFGKPKTMSQSQLKTVQFITDWSSINHGSAKCAQNFYIKQSNLNCNGYSIWAKLTEISSTMYQTFQVQKTEHFCGQVNGLETNQQHWELE
jgi:hypothetical protein